MPEILSIQARFLAFLAARGISDRQAAKMIGASHTYVNHLRKGSSMTLDKLERILGVYPELNRRWLIEGVGEMLHDPERAYTSREAQRILRALRDGGADAALLDTLAGMIAALEDERNEVRAELMEMLRQLG